jgi:hypothetical protein
MWKPELLAQFVQPSPEALVMISSPARAVADERAEAATRTEASQKCFAFMCEILSGWKMASCAQA